MNGFAAAARNLTSAAAAAQRSSETNRIQIEFNSNGGIAPFGAFLASNHPRQKQTSSNGELLSLHTADNLLLLFWK